MSENKRDLIDSFGEYGNLTPEESISLAQQTNDRLKGKTIDDIIKLDLATINNAYALIVDDNVKSIELKSLLNNLLEMITNLTSLSRELFNWQSRSYLTNVWGSDNFNSDLATKTDFASQISAIQDKLTRDYPELMKLENKNDSIIAETVRQTIREIIVESGIIIEGTSSVEESIKVALDEIRGYSVLTPYMNQPNNVPFEDFVEEIRVDDFNDIRVVISGREVRTNVSFKSPEHVLLFANKLLRETSQATQFTPANPFARLRLGSTTRVSMMRNPIAIRDDGIADGPNRPVVHICIRRQRSDPFTPEMLKKLGSINDYGSALISTFLKSGVSMCFYGGTGTGKTSMFNAFTGDISSDERMITMAEVDEMKVRRIDKRRFINKAGKKVVNPNYLKAINSALMWECPDMEKEILPGLKGFGGMFNAALTMTPYTIMMQESKGKEAQNLIEAAISDHQVLTTVHAKNEKVLVNRLFKMLQQGETTTSEEVIFKDIVTAFPVVVGCSRYKDGSRKISSIVEYITYIPTTKEIATNTLCKFVVTSNKMVDGKLKVFGNHLNYALPTKSLKEEMLSKGLLHSEWTALETMYKDSRSEKPHNMDRLIYEGTLFDDEAL